MATDATPPQVEWQWDDVAHKPKEGSIEAFKAVETNLKKDLIKMRRDRGADAPEYFGAAVDLSDEQLTSFSSDDFVLVRVATNTASRNKTLFGKVFIPASENGYIHVRMHISGDGVTLHSIHTESNPKAAIFSKDDELEYFET